MIVLKCARRDVDPMLSAPERLFASERPTLALDDARASENRALDGIGGDAYCGLERAHIVHFVGGVRGNGTTKLAQSLNEVAVTYIYMPCLTLNSTLVRLPASVVPDGYGC